MQSGNNGLFSKAKEAKENMKKAEASDKMNMKITEAQIQSYGKNGQMPSLKQLGMFLQADNEIEYANGAKELREANGDFNWESIAETEVNYVYTKLEEYPYEFCIDSSFRLASVDGVKVAATNNNIEELKNKIEQLEATIRTMNESITTIRENTSEILTEEQVTNTVNEMLTYKTIGTTTGSNGINISNTNYNEYLVMVTYNGKSSQIIIPKNEIATTSKNYNLILFADWNAILKTIISANKQSITITTSNLYYYTSSTGTENKLNNTQIVVYGR